MGIHAPYYRWFVKDYSSDSRVIAMTDDQDLAYRRMLDASWEQGALPNNVDHLAMIVRYSQDRFRRAWSYPLIDCWEENGHGTLINQRLEDEREAMLARSEKARKAVKQREKKRRKRLKTGVTQDKREMISGASNDHRLNIHPKPKPNKATTSQNRQPSNKKRSVNPGDRIDFVRRATAKESDFEGPGLERLKERLREYGEEFSDDWLWARWLKAKEWAFDNKEVSRKSWKQFLETWFRNDAARARERGQGN